MTKLRAAETIAKCVGRTPIQKVAGEPTRDFAIIDGLKGFPEAINSVFPDTQIQTLLR
jgi:hypothetical protein